MKFIKDKKMLRFKLFGLLLLFICFAEVALAQNENNQRASVIRIEGSGQYTRNEADFQANPGQPVIVADGFSYYTTSGGIFLILPRQTNYVRLFTLTGQVIWNGELVSGKFFIPTGKGIYFLRVNNKSYKLNCK
jgi:hypothetical protein